MIKAVHLSCLSAAVLGLLLMGLSSTAAASPLSLCPNGSTATSIYKTLASAGIVFPADANVGSNKTVPNYTQPEERLDCNEHCDVPVCAVMPVCNYPLGQ